VGGLGLHVYTQIHRSGFLNGDKMSHVYENPLDTALFMGITAEQEQVVKLFKLNILNNKTNK